MTLLQREALAYSYRAVPNAGNLNTNQRKRNRESMYNLHLRKLMNKFAPGSGPPTSRLYTMKNWKNRNITINSTAVGIENKLKPIYKKLRELAAAASETSASASSAQTAGATINEKIYNKYSGLMTEGLKELNHLKSVYNKHGINSTHVITNISELRQLVNFAENKMRKQRAAIAKAAENAQREKQAAENAQRKKQAAENARKKQAAENAQRKKQAAENAQRKTQSTANAQRKTQSTANTQRAELQEVVNALPASAKAAANAAAAKAAAKAAANASKAAVNAAKANAAAKIAAIKRNKSLTNKQSKINSIQAEYVTLSRAANAAEAAHKQAASNVEAANAALKALQARRNRLRKGKGPASQSNAGAASNNASAKAENMKREKAERARGAGSSSNGQRRTSPPKPTANASAAKAAEANRERKKKLLDEVEQRMNMNALIRDARIQRNKNASKMTNEQKRVVGHQGLSNQNLRNMLAALNKEGGLSNKPIYKRIKSASERRESAAKEATNKAESNAEKNKWNRILNGISRGMSPRNAFVAMIKQTFGNNVTLPTNENKHKRIKLVQIAGRYHPDKKRANKAKATSLHSHLHNLTTKI